MSEKASRVEYPAKLGDLENLDCARFHLTGGGWIDVTRIGDCIEVRGARGLSIEPHVSNLFTVKLRDR